MGDLWLPWGTEGRGSPGSGETGPERWRSVCRCVQAGKCLHPESLCVLQSSWVHWAENHTRTMCCGASEAVTGPRGMGRLPASRTQAVGDIEYRGAAWLGGLDPKQAKLDIETPLAG